MTKVLPCFFHQLPWSFPGLFWAHFCPAEPEGHRQSAHGAHWSKWCQNKPQHVFHGFPTASAPHCRSPGRNSRLGTCEFPPSEQVNGGECNIWKERGAQRKICGWKAQFSMVFTWYSHGTVCTEAASEERLPTRWKRLSEIRGILMKFVSICFNGKLRDWSPALTSLQFGFKSMTVRDHQTCGPPSFTAFLCITLLHAIHFLFSAYHCSSSGCSKDSKANDKIQVVWTFAGSVHWIENFLRSSIVCIVFVSKSRLSPLGSLHRVSLPRPCLTWAEKVQRNTTSDSLTWCWYTAAGWQTISKNGRIISFKGFVLTNEEPFCQSSSRCSENVLEHYSCFVLWL